MKRDEESYTRVAGFLRSSHVSPPDPGRLAERVMEKLEGESRKRSFLPGIENLIFGWTSVVWIRRSLAFASLLLVCIFVYQQFEIMSGVKDINLRMKSGGGIEVRPSSVSDLGRTLASGMSLPLGADSIKVSVDDIRRLIESYKELELSQERINKILQRNPHIIKMIEKAYRESLPEDGSKPKI